jgi:hypothetical protein
MDEVEAELAPILSAQVGSAVQQSQIHRMPMRGFEVFTTFANAENVLYKIPLSLRGNPNTTFLDSIPKTLDIRITGTYLALKDFVNSGVLSCRAFLNSAAVTTNAISIVYQQLDQSGFVQNLKGEGKLSDNVDYSSSSEGGGFQIAGIGTGGTVSHAQDTSSMDRYVSRNLMQHGLEEGNGELKITEYVESQGGDFNALKNQLVNFMLAQMEKIRAEFVTKDNRTWDLVNSITGDALGLNMSLKDIATLTNGSAQFDQSEEAKLNMGKVSASDKKTLGFKDSADIQWKASGNILVPSTVDLYLYSQNTFKQRIQAFYSQDDIKFQRTMLESPGPMKSQDYSGYMPPDVGTIVASMVPWEKQSQEFKQYWSPADGREVDHTTRYFALISGLDAASPNATLVHVNVPDLRGVFLRGLNDFAADVGARNDQYADPDKNRTPGGAQKDEFERHTHYLPQKHIIAGGGHDAEGWGFTSNGDNPPHGEWRTDMDDVQNKRMPPGGDETRPKNVAIYYYIRVN